MELTGNVALVTGGASGLGEATVRRLHDKGAKVVIVDFNPEKGKALADELGDRAMFVQTDVTDGDQVAAAVEQAKSFGDVRFGIICAGTGTVMRTIGKDGSPHMFSEWERVLKVNLYGTFHALTHFAGAIAGTEPLVDGQRGALVMTASVAAFDGQIGQIAYSATKGGVVGMTLPAARDLAVVGIRVCTIAPGVMDTPLLGMLPEEARDALGKSVLFPKRLGDPAEFAKLVESIVANDYLNGEVIRLDGGIRMPPK